jgi:hypothetical protein
MLNRIFPDRRNAAISFGRLSLNAGCFLLLTLYISLALNKPASGALTKMDTDGAMYG